MVQVRIFLGMMAGEKHHKIAEQIGKRMDAVRNKALRFRKHTYRHLEQAQKKIDSDTDPGAAGCDSRSFCKDSLIVFRLIAILVGNHGKSAKN